MSEFRLDWEREARTGIAEAVLCEGKSAEQIAAILDAATEAGRALLLTRLAEPLRHALPARHAGLDYDPLSRTAVHGTVPAPARGGAVIVCAGTSDLPVAHEARRALAFSGYSAPVVADVGVAGLWRLMERLEEIREHAVVIAVAGMEGALFSVLAGLVRAPVVAVPTSVGYGVAAGGRAALSSALGTCAPGIAAVNVDNGFGAACVAVRILHAADRRG